MTLPTRTFGRTDHATSLAVLGGAAFWATTTEAARPAFEAAIERGVTHLDIAPQYGTAEAAIGPLVPAVRDRLFVGCKTLRANPEGVRAQFDESRRLLGCEVFDLYQAHGVTDLAELDRRDAALATIVELRERGLTRFAGITGHDHGAPAAFSEALRRYDLDSVLFPVNPLLWADPAYRESAEALLATCVERNVGVMAIKAVARRPWADRRPLADALAEHPDTTERWAGTWYEPHRDLAAVTRGVRFALSTPGVTAVCTPGEVALLDTVLDACEGFAPMDDAERAEAIEAAVAAGDQDIFPLPR